MADNLPRPFMYKCILCHHWHYYTSSIGKSHYNPNRVEGLAFKEVKS